MSDSVALVSAVDPYPKDAGKKVVLAGIVEYLIDRVGRENVHYVMVGGDERNPFPVELHGISRPHPLAAITRAMTRATTRRASLQESLLGTGHLRRDIHRTLERIGPTTEIYDTVRMAQHAPARSGSEQICYLDDLFSERYQSMLSAADRFPDVKVRPLGNFATHVPRRLRPLAEHPGSQRRLLKVEQELVRRSEDRTAHRFDTTLVINEQEAARLRHRCGAATGRVCSIPPLLARSSPASRDYWGAPDFVFIGQLSLPHNDDGLRNFLRRIWPLVLRSRPDARLRVVGRDPLPALTELVAQHSQSVSLDGFVPDLTAVLSRSAALINPLRFGSGVKLKVIEALGAGVPVVSTTIGADGVATGFDEGVLVSDDDAEIADLLLAATDTRTNVALSVAAAEHFAVRYSRNVVFDCYDRIFSPGAVHVAPSPREQGLTVGRHD